MGRQTSVSRRSIAPLANIPDMHSSHPIETNIVIEVKKATDFANAAVKGTQFLETALEVDPKPLEADIVQSIEQDENQVDDAVTENNNTEDLEPAEMNAQLPPSKAPVNGQTIALLENNGTGNRCRSKQPSSKVQKHKGKPRHSNKHGIQHQSKIAFQSIDVLEILRKKLEAERFEQQHHIQEERMQHQSLMSEVQAHAQERLVAAKSANVQLQHDLDQSEKRVKAYSGKFKQIKTYTDGLSHDLHQLRLDHLKLVQNCETLTKDQVRSQLREEKRQRKLHEALEDVQKLEEELESTRVAHALLRERHGSLEKQLGDTGGQLIEERTKGVHFQNQLGALSAMYGELTSSLRDLKCGKNKRLDAATNEEIESVEKVLEDQSKVEECLRLLRTLSANEQVSGMEKSLTELSKTLPAL